MRNAAMDRRRFLETSGQAAAGAAVIAAAGGTTLLMAPDGAWAMTLGSAERAGRRDPAQGAARHLSRTTAWATSTMRRWSRRWTGGQGQGPKTRGALLTEGVAEPRSGHGCRSSSCPRATSCARSRAIAGQRLLPDDRASRRSRPSTTIRVVWQAFGYEGASFDRAATSTRGFDDLGWLPDPPRGRKPAGRAVREGNRHGTYRSERQFGRHRDRLRRRRRHARQRALPERRQCGAARGRASGYAIDDFVNDEWNSFLQLAWLDKRTTSGTWRVAKDFPNLPPWICKTVGGTTDPLGRRLAALPGRTSSEGAHRVRRSRRRQSARLAADLRGDGRRYYTKAEDKMGVTRTHDIPGLPGNNNFKVMYNGANPRRLQERPHRPHGDQQPAARRSRRRACSSASASRAASPAPSGRRSTPRSRRPRRPDKLDLRPESMVLQIQHDDAGKVTGVLYADKDGNQQVQKARAVCVAVQLDRDAAAAAELGLGEVPGRARQLLGPGRPQLHAPHHRARSTRSSTSRCACTAARPWPGSSPTSSRNDPARGFVGGYELETLSLGLPFMAAFLEPGAWGRDFAWAMESYAHMAGHVDRRRGHAAGEERRHAASDREGPAWPADPERAFRRPRQRRRDAQPRLQAGPGGLRGGRGNNGSTRRRPIPRPTTSAPVDRVPSPRTASVTSSARPTTSRTCSSRTAASSPPARPRTRP